MEKKALDLLDTSSNEIKTDTMTIEKNILKLKNTSIQLSNISQVYIGDYSRTFPLKQVLVSIAIIIIGLVILTSLQPLIGLLIILLPAYYLYSVYKNSNIKKTYLHFSLNSGKDYYITFSDVEFANQVRTVIENSFDGKKDSPTFINLGNQTINNSDNQSINYGQQTNTINSNNSDSSVHISGENSFQNSAIGQHNTVQGNSTITNQDWHIIINELEHVHSSLNESSQLKSTVTSALEIAKEKNSSKFIDFVKTHRNELTSETIISLTSSAFSVLLSNLLV